MDIQKNYSKMELIDYPPPKLGASDLFWPSWLYFLDNKYFWSYVDFYYNINIEINFVSF